MAADVPMNADAGDPGRRRSSVVLQAVGIAGLFLLAVILREDPPGWLVGLTVGCLVVWLIWETAQKRRPERRPVNRILDAEIRYLLLGVVMLVGGVSAFLSSDLAAGSRLLGGVVVAGGAVLLTAGALDLRAWVRSDPPL
jgi:hypothetical protein